MLIGKKKQSKRKQGSGQNSHFDFPAMEASPNPSRLNGPPNRELVRAL